MFIISCATVNAVCSVIYIYIYNIVKKQIVLVSQIFNSKHNNMLITTN